MILITRYYIKTYFYFIIRLLHNHLFTFAYLYIVIYPFMFKTIIKNLILLSIEN